MIQLSKTLLMQETAFELLLLSFAARTLLTSLLVDTKAAFELQQGDGLVFVQVAVVGELAGTPLGLGFLLDVALEWLHLLLVDVVAAIVVKLGEVPVHHPLLQRVTGVWLHKPAWMKCSVGLSTVRTHVCTEIQTEQCGLTTPWVMQESERWE